MHKDEIRVRIKREHEEEVAEVVPWEVAKLLRAVPLDDDVQHLIVERRRVASWETAFESRPVSARAGRGEAEPERLPGATALDEATITSLNLNWPSNWRTPSRLAGADRRYEPGIVRVGPVDFRLSTLAISALGDRSLETVLASKIQSALESLDCEGRKAEASAKLGPEKPRQNPAGGEHA